MSTRAAVKSASDSDEIVAYVPKKTLQHLTDCGNVEADVASGGEDFRPVLAISQDLRINEDVY